MVYFKHIIFVLARGERFVEKKENDLEVGRLYLQYASGLKPIYSLTDIQKAKPDSIIFRNKHKCNKLDIMCRVILTMRCMESSTVQMRKKRMTHMDI